MVAVPLLSVAGLKRLHMMCVRAKQRAVTVVHEAAESCGADAACLALTKKMRATLHLHATQVCQRSHDALHHARAEAHASLSTLKQTSLEVCKRAKARYNKIKGLSSKACMGDRKCLAHVGGITSKYWSKAAVAACRHAAQMHRLQVPGVAAPKT